MENFFNYIAKPLNADDVEVWFKVNNIFPEKMELFSDFAHSLNYLIRDTYLGEDEDVGKETKINLTQDDNKKHFSWCWNKTVDNFEKENLLFDREGEHYDYFESFFMEIFYEQKDKKIRDSIEKFFLELFDYNKAYTKSDLDMIYAIYKNLDKTLKTKKK
jgi:hypothetical protein